MTRRLSILALLLISGCTPLAEWWIAVDWHMEQQQKKEQRK